MKRQRGFTLLELVIVLGVLGILVASAIPLYRTFQQRASGSEATAMLKRILDAQVMYFLDKETFFPPVIGDVIQIFHNDPPGKEEISRIKSALNLEIPVGHFLDFEIRRLENSCLVTISSPQHSFPLFRDGSPSIVASVDDTGKITF
jgi:prepilin-type N-terminal cleavage/methylation domain-containing protein